VVLAVVGQSLGVRIPNTGPAQDAVRADQVRATIVLGLRVQGLALLLDHIPGQGLHVCKQRRPMACQVAVLGTYCTMHLLTSEI
jgi:hypothetical protein